MLTKACILEDEAISSFKAAIGIEYGYEVMVLKMLDEFNNREEDVSVSHRHLL
jgi:hypothetical protein